MKKNGWWWWWCFNKPPGVVELAPLLPSITHTPGGTLYKYSQLAPRCCCCLPHHSGLSSCQSTILRTTSHTYAHSYGLARDRALSLSRHVIGGVKFNNNSRNEGVYY